MPVYTYQCENCQHQFEKRQSFNEETLKVCPNCRKHRLRKVYSPAGVVFKGSGFYVTDKRAPSSVAAQSSNNKSKDSTKVKDDSKKKVSKPGVSEKKPA